MVAIVSTPGRIRSWVLMAIETAAAVVRSAQDVKSDALVATLFEQEGLRLVRLARLFTDDRNAAEDLVQEAFIRLHRAAHKIEDPAKSAPYLRSILINLARDQNRRGLMSLRHQEAMISDAIPDQPEDLVMEADESGRIIEQLRELSPRQRDCLLLRFYMELTEVEIAETLGISANSVKTHCRRGMASLRERIEESR